MIYHIDNSSMFYKNKDDARKAILDRGHPIGLNTDRMFVLGQIFNEDGIKCGEVLWNVGEIPDMPRYLFEDCQTNHVWPMNRNGTLINDPNHMKCCHPDCAEFYLGYEDGPGFKTLQDAIKGFQTSVRGHPDGDGILILSKDGTYRHMAIRITNKYCAGADEGGIYHLLKKDGSFGKMIDVEINGKNVHIQAVVRNDGEIDFIV